MARAATPILYAGSLFQHMMKRAEVFQSEEKFKYTRNMWSHCTIISLSEQRLTILLDLYCHETRYSLSALLLY